MDMKDLMAISGYPGLYRFISQGRNAIIVESLEDKKRMSVYSTSKISTLEEIAVFTDSGEMPLADVFKRMYEYSEGSEVISHKSANKEIKRFFEEVLPVGSQSICGKIKVVENLALNFLAVMVRFFVRFNEGDSNGQ